MHPFLDPETTMHTNTGMPGHSCPPVPMKPHHASRTAAESNRSLLFDSPTTRGAVQDAGTRKGKEK